MGEFTSCYYVIWLEKFILFFQHPFFLKNLIVLQVRWKPLTNINTITPINRINTVNHNYSKEGPKIKPNIIHQKGTGKSNNAPEAPTGLCGTFKLGIGSDSLT